MFYFCLRGAAGLKLCMFCKNVVGAGRGLTRGQHYFVDISCADPNRFDKASDADIWRAFDKVAASQGVLTKAELDTLEKAAGVSYNENGLITDLQLRSHVKPASGTVMDWLHNVLTNGTASFEVAAFLNCCYNELGIKYSDLDSFVRSAWRFPFAQSTHKIDAVFSSSREKNAGGTFKASGSELLMALPLLRYFADTVVSPTRKLDKQVLSLQRLCDVVDTILWVKRGRSTRFNIAGLMQQHLEAHVAVYGIDQVKPKHHFQFHNADDIQSTSGTKKVEHELCAPVAPHHCAFAC